MPIVKIESAREAILAPVRRSMISANTAAFFTLFVGIIILPLISLSQFGIGPDVAKKFFLLGVLVVTIALWLVGRLQDGEVKLPWSLPMIFLPLISVSFIISAIFSTGVRHSLLGSLYQSGTALSILALSALTFFIVLFVDSRKHLFNLYLGISLAALVVAVYYLLVVPLGSWLWPSLFNYLPQVLIGKWYETAVFFGFTALVALFMLELPALGTSLVLKRLSIASFVASLLMLMFTNFTIVWIITGVIALSVFVYALAASAGQQTEVRRGFLDGRQVFRPSFFFLLLALLFIILGRPGGPLNDGLNTIYAKANVSFVEVRPGWASTLMVATEVLKRDPLTGIGPNNFSNAWASYRPRVVNELQYWNVDFADSVGIIPTFVVTTGLAGTLALVLFFLSLVYVAVKSISKLPNDPLTQFLVVLSGVGALYFWLTSFLYTPDAIGLPMLFVMTGLFLASLTVAKILPVKTIQINSNPRTYFAYLLVLVLLLVMAITGGYILLQRFWSVVRYQQATVALAKSEVDKADSLVISAIKLNSKDPLYYRLLSRIKLEELNRLISTAEGKSESAKPILQNMIGTAIAAAQEAVKLDPGSYGSTVALGNVYEYLAGLGVAGAYDQAKVAYEDAAKKNQNNPEILLSLARLEITQGKFASARTYLEKALAIKSNYSSSILLLSQLDLEDIGTSAAIKRLETALAAVPNDTSLLFQLGFLRYRAGDYEGTANAMRSVISFSPGGLNANASYFLGLAYDKLGQTAKAIEQFALIARYNPDNVEVKEILRNLRAGRPALAGLGEQAPAEAEPAEEDDQATEAEATKEQKK
ncbi:MAG: hypothetical protein A2571_01805 [Candidatus Vogelbacteria bacterium RIFOXYD1_FULL_44_32]|uniref:Uncharacterized protein n=1 Tax=Candidatus Vogelbacteria bacterium RIFOXYD1_FULL_44_32 TaxID=1802438 RepID=A0A1G2QER5_9BACT|nr:MAG: hypothetical protein A2571_01805 [Candidatus Vogelbacteria bacterium RIFOXYD1_FULL_44_32]